MEDLSQYMNKVKRPTLVTEQERLRAEAYRKIRTEYTIDTKKKFKGGSFDDSNYSTR